MSDNDPGEWFMFLVMALIGVPVFGWLLWMMFSVLFLGAGRLLPAVLMSEPKREQDRRPTICCCVVGINECTAFTSGPDEPICVACVRNKHPEHERFKPRIKPWVEVEANYLALETLDGIPIEWTWGGKPLPP